MELKEKDKRILINEVVKIFAKLPEYTGNLHCKASISEGNIVISFGENIRKELVRLFKKQYKEIRQVKKFERRRVRTIKKCIQSYC